jgi:hypothetical protein
MVQGGVLTDVFCTITELMVEMGALRIEELVGCWEVDLDGCWYLAVNGHDSPMLAAHGEWCEVPARMAAVWRDGHILAWADPWQGLIPVEGMMVDEGELVEAINGAIGRAQGN